MWIVKCQNGNTYRFESRTEAEKWAEWGHFCLSGHSIKKDSKNA